MKKIITTILTTCMFITCMFISPLKIQADTIIDCTQKVIYISTYEELKTELETYIESNETIILNQDITYELLDDYTNIEVNNPNTVVIDFNGYNIYFTANKHDEMFELNKKCDLRLINTKTNVKSTFYFFITDKFTGSRIGFYHLNSDDANLTIYNVDHRLQRAYEDWDYVGSVENFVSIPRILTFEHGHFDVKSGRLDSRSINLGAIDCPIENPTGSFTVSGGTIIYSCRIAMNFLTAKTLPKMQIYDARIIASPSPNNYFECAIAVGDQTVTIGDITGKNLLYGDSSEVTNVLFPSLTRPEVEVYHLSTSDELIFNSHSNEQEVMDDTILIPQGHILLDEETGGFLNVTPHNYIGATVEEQKATCTQEGSTRVKCQYQLHGKSCNHYQTTTISNALGHIEVIEQGYDATCIANGLTDGSHCSRCNEVLVKQEIIPALGHTVVVDKAIEPTCTKTGLTEGSHCVECGEVLVKQAVIPVIEHKYTNKVATKATLSSAGKLVPTCTCGNTKTAITIPKVSSVALSKTSFVYDGKVKTPTVTVKDASGKVLVKNTDYTVTVPTGRKNVGKYTYTIKGKGKYNFTKTLTYKINPKTTSISKLTPVSKGFTATWKKQTTQTTGYQIRYSTKSSMASSKTVTITKNTTVSKKVTKLTARKKYYVQVRTYKTVNGTKYYSAWCAKKYTTTKA